MHVENIFKKLQKILKNLVTAQHHLDAFLTHYH